MMVHRHNTVHLMYILLYLHLVEEGPPSPASTVLTKVDGQTVTISGMDTATSKSNTNLANKRIYRSNTGSNTTNFQFVKEVSLATASTTDNLNNDALAEIIPSTYWIAPRR